MRRYAVVPLVATLMLSSCTRTEKAEAPPPAATEASNPTEGALTPAPADPGPRAFVLLKDGSKVPGSIVASSRTDMVLMGDDGIERKIPLAQIKSVQYTEEKAPAPAQTQPRTIAKSQPSTTPAPTPERETPRLSPAPVAPTAAPAPAVTTKTYELPAGTEISVRTNEAINSETATPGQSFDVQVTRDAVDANGDVVIPRRSNARVVIRSASGGGRVKGASDLSLDLQSVVIAGKTYNIDTADVTKAGKDGVGSNRRTATHVGGGAALGAIIGAIAGGGKGAAIGAGAGAGAGALAQILTKGRDIKVPAESVLTFKLDSPLKVTRAD
ncbi:MAG TPA: hypothetical protein VER03_18900 [Bryobacteraceae bacterium]|nr:hypothetical protein [Bryobacteraceae bacterium]